MEPYDNNNMHFLGIPVEEVIGRAKRPTLGCSIEISRDMYIVSVASWAKMRRRNYVAQTRVCSKTVLGG